MAGKDGAQASRSGFESGSIPRSADPDSVSHVILVLHMLNWTLKTVEEKLVLLLCIHESCFVRIMVEFAGFANKLIFIFVRSHVSSL